MSFVGWQRMDLGECPKVHDHALRADFETASKERDYFYDIDAMEHLEEFIVDCDRRTEVAKKKLKETQDDLTEEATVKVWLSLSAAVFLLGCIGQMGNVDKPMLSI